MTLSKFIKTLQKLEPKYGRHSVAVDKDSLIGGDEAMICQVTEVKTEYVYTSDGDGGIITNKDGSERGATMVVIKG